MTGAPVAVVRVIARLNVGGPAHHVTALAGRLDPARYRSTLVTGHPGQDEDPAAALAARHGARLIELEHLSPAVRPLADLRALGSLVRLLRRERPAIVHTHTAKAGLVGRLAALGLRPRPVVVHTYHGHVLRGYFGRALSEAHRRVERALARRTDALVCVSAATRDDLVALGVAAADRFVVVPLGLELERFAALGRSDRDAARRELGLAADEVALLFTGRLVPIKRVDRLLRALAIAYRRDARVRLLIAGSGRERPRLEAQVAQLGLRAQVRFLGHRDDVERLLAAADVAVLSSDQEGTPVALIEAAAAGVPAVATRVGGVADVVCGSGGLLVEPADEHGFADAILALAADAGRREAMGAAARDHVLPRFALRRLLDDVDVLYGELLARRLRRG